MRFFWKENAVISLKLAENIYTLCQMSERKHTMAFFNIFRDTDNWLDVDLSQEKIIMIVHTMGTIQDFGERKITPKEVKPLEEIIIPDKYWVAHLNEIENFHKGEFYLKGGCLFQEIENQESIRLNNDLDCIKDREDILQYEMETVYSPQHIQTRLLFNHKYQKDFDYFKHKIFPNLYEEEMFQQFLKMEKEFDIKLSSEAYQSD
ncbi:hypothetical protein [Capnocytophaga sp.]|uniref:hypothetical protein n=1 Tax=Capnocytophaga sp. TaxID=44737 RepID=UPI0026DD5306|nr:hypothetical protein [Capnocytophaga sp.]MDO5106078.1 hypothetical protein [Capnocytophaga sp.]